MTLTRDEAQTAWEKIIDIGFSDYNQLSKDQKIWFNIEPLTMDGIIDHYINNAAEHNQDTIDALEFLGFPDIAQNMRIINKLFKTGQPPADITKRNKEWDSWCEFHEALLDEIDNYLWTKCSELETALLVHINKTGVGVN